MKNDAERILTDTVRRDLISKLALGITNWMDETGLFKSCLNCEHWIEGTQAHSTLAPEQRQICGLYKMRPPTKVIVCGCDSHSDNIPF